MFVQQGRVRAWFWRVLLVLAGLFGLALLGAWLFLKGSLAQLDGTRTVAGLHSGVSVARDALGVPLIHASDRRDAAYATGFVHAQERFFQMDSLRRVAAGELAELFGPRAVALDKTHRLHRFRARAEQALQNLPASERQLLERYVAGVNDGLNGLQARPFEYVLVGRAPKAWSAADSLLVIWAMYFDLQGGQERRKLARGWLREHTTSEQLAFLLPQSTQWDAPLDAGQVAAPSQAIPPGPPGWWAGPRAPDGHVLGAVNLPDFVGSNNWALAGSRSKNGAALVSNDMHLGLQLPNTWYRLALQFPQGGGTMRRMVGVTLPGLPLVVAGSNGQVAWGLSNSYGDYLDLVEVLVDPAKPGWVRTPGGWERTVTHEEVILVKGAPAEKLRVRETSLGPLRTVAGRSYAIRWVAHAPRAVNLFGVKLESAATVDDALAIAAAMGIPAQNFIAGDAQGHIGWTIAGPLPQRRLTGLAASFPLAANHGAVSWQGWLAPSSYPQARNPAGAQLSTANSRQLMGPGADAIGDGGFDFGARSHQVRAALTALGPRTDVAGAYGVTLDDRAIFLSAWRDRALAALDGSAIAQHPQRAQFLHWLKNGWSGHASVDSVAYLITRNFMLALYDLVFEHVNGELARLDAKAGIATATSRWPVVLARLLDERPAAWLPPGHASWQALQLAAIDRVIADLNRDGKDLAAATWGKRNTVAIAHPVAAAVPMLGRWLAAPADMLAGDSNMPRVAGPNFGQSERMTVAPGKEEEGVFTMPGGQSGHPLSPFFLAGHRAWVAGQPTPLLPGPAKHILTFVK